MLTVTYVSNLTVVKTLTGDFISAGDQTYAVDGMNSNAVLTAATTPPVNKHSAAAITIASSGGTIDLTALPDDNDGPTAVDFTGLHVALMKLRCPASNVAAVVVEVGDANGYELFGGSWSLALNPGDEVTFKGLGDTPAVSGTAKNIDYAGTDDDVLHVLLVAGEEAV